jgi:hypothetical protein
MCAQPPAALDEIDFALIERKLDKWIEMHAEESSFTEAATEEVRALYSNYFAERGSSEHAREIMKGGEELFAKARNSVVIFILCLCVEQLLIYGLAKIDQRRRDENLAKIENLRRFSKRLLGQNPDVFQTEWAQTAIA